MHRPNEWVRGAGGNGAGALGEGHLRGISVSESIGAALATEISGRYRRAVERAFVFKGITRFAYAANGSESVSGIAECF